MKFSSLTHTQISHKLIKQYKLGLFTLKHFHSLNSNLNLSVLSHLLCLVLTFRPTSSKAKNLEWCLWLRSGLNDQNLAQTKKVVSGWIKLNHSLDYEALFLMIQSHFRLSDQLQEDDAGYRHSLNNTIRKQTRREAK